MTIRRYPGDPFIRPADVRPSGLDFEVSRLCNPAVIRLAPEADARITRILCSLA